MRKIYIWKYGQTFYFFFFFPVDRKSIERRTSWKVILAMSVRNPASAFFQKGSPFGISVPMCELLSNVHTLILATALSSNSVFVILISRWTAVVISNGWSTGAAGRTPCVVRAIKLEPQPGLEVQIKARLCTCCFDCCTSSSPDNPEITPIDLWKMSRKIARVRITGTRTIQG